MEHAQGYDRFIHIGPGSLLCSISKEWYEQKEMVQVQSNNDFKQLCMHKNKH